VKRLVLRLRAEPDQRLDLSPMVPERLAGRNTREIGAIAIHTTRRAVTIGDMFDLSIGDVETIIIEGGSDRLDRVGEAMSRGTLVVEGDVGNRAGRAMTGGRLMIRGHAGHWTASGNKAGRIEVAGDVGDRLAGPLPGEIRGMSGGLVVVRGKAGERAGDRLRRGILIVEGAAAAYAGSRMLAGTPIVGGDIGPEAGYLLRRGTIVVGAETGVSATFVDCGVQELVANRLMAAFLAADSAAAASLLRRPLRRFAGDMAVLGKGEIFVVT